MIRRVATPAVGAAATALVAFVTLCSVIGRPAAVVTATAIAGAWGWVARARRQATGADSRPLVERVGGCALGPGVAVHAVRVSDRLLVVGVSGFSIALLRDSATPEGCPDEAFAGRVPPPRVPASLVRSAGIAVAVAVGCILAAPAAATARQQSVHQTVDLESGAADRSSPPVPQPDRPAVAPPLSVPAPDPVDLPGVAATPLGPMVWLALLALLPFALMSVTSFVKISVVLSLLRNALGTPQVPSDPLLAGIALSLTCFVMAPVGNEAWSRISASGGDLSTAAGMLTAATAAAVPVRSFLQRNARPDEVALFVSLSARNGQAAAEPNAFAVLVPAFVTSELREAFVAGFFLFIPFLVVDLVVANILMSMGMVMVSPTTVSLPFKLLLFVLVDGWPLLAKGLALSYQ